MAPIFYCRCTNCNCTATLLITQKMEKTIETEEDFLMEEEQQRREENNCSAEALQPSIGKFSPNALERTSLILESVFLLMCFIILIIGKYV